MDCVTGQDNLITCSGGVGAAVYMFLPAFGTRSGVTVKPRLHLHGTGRAQGLESFDFKLALSRWTQRLPKAHHFAGCHDGLPKDAIISRNQRGMVLLRNNVHAVLITQNDFIKGG